MPRHASVHYCKRAGCFVTTAFGERRINSKGKAYRLKVFARHLTHPTKDRRAADAWLADGLRAMTAGRRSLAELTLDEVAEMYLAVAEIELSPETYARRVEQLQRCLAWPDYHHPQRLGLTLITRLTKADVRPFLAEMIEQGRSPAYVTGGLLMALKRLTSWAASVEPGESFGLPIRVDPLAGMKGPEILRRQPRELPESAARSFLRWLWRRVLKKTGPARPFAQITTILVWALRETGARPKELLAAEWSEYSVMPDGWGLIVLPAWKHKTGRKTGKTRKIAIPPAIAKRIEWIRGLEGRHERFLFTRRCGDPWVKVDDRAKRVGDSKAFQRWFGRAVDEAQAAGLPLPEGFRLYWQRSGYATEARRNGVPDALLAEAMGTSVIMLERSYTDLTTEDVLNAAKRARNHQVLRCS